jgi:hypothetical protein
MVVKVVVSTLTSHNGGMKKTTTPIGTSLPLARKVKRRPLTPVTYEGDHPGAFGLTYEQLGELVRWAQVMRGEM